MAKSKKKWRPKVGPKDFTKIKIALLAMGFERVTAATMRRDAKRFNLTPPNAKRIKETIDQVSYQKWFEGNYKMSIHTSYNLRLNRFTQTGGRGWAMVSEGVTERIYANSFYRTKSFTDSIILEARFLNERLTNRPISKLDTQLMKLKQERNGDTMWISVTNHRNTLNFFEDIPEELEEDVLKALDKKLYYHRVVRPRKGITEYSRDHRKLWN